MDLRIANLAEAVGYDHSGRLTLFGLAPFDPYASPSGPFGIITGACLVNGGGRMLNEDIHN